MLLSWDFLVKKVTVTGIIGNTQGVSNAIIPPKNPNRKIESMLLFLVPSSPQLFTGLLMLIDGTNIFVVDSTPPSNATVNGKAVAG